MPLSVEPFTRRRRAIAFLLLLGLGCLVGRSAAQGLAESGAGEPWRLTSYLDEADMRDSWIWDASFAADGTVWMAGTRGLLRFDGYEWTLFGTADGLPSAFVRCVEVLRDGTVWVGTDRGAGTFDGERFDPRGSAAGLVGPSVRRIVEDSRGALWFCCDRWPKPEVSCGLSRFADGAWTSYGRAEGLPNDYIYDVFEDRDGDLWVLTREGLALRTGDGFALAPGWAALPDPAQALWSMVQAGDGCLLVCGSRDFFVRSDGEWRARRVPLDGRPGQPRMTATRDGAVFTLSFGQGTEFREMRADDFAAVSAPLRADYSSLECIAEAPDGSVWAFGHHLLLRWERSAGEWEHFPDLGSPTLVDARGAIWFGAKNSKIARVLDDDLRAFGSARGKVQADALDAVWALGDHGPLRWTAGSGAPDPGPGERFAELGLGRPSKLAIAPEGTAWVLAADVDERETLARFQDGAWSRVPIPDLAPDERIEELWPDAHRGAWARLARGSDQPCRILHLAADGLQPVPLPRTLARTDRPRVRQDAQGTRWAYGTPGLFRRARSAADWRAVEGLPGTHVFNLGFADEHAWAFCIPTAGGRPGSVRVGFDGRVDRVLAGGVDTVRDPAGELRFVRARETLLADIAGEHGPRALRLPTSASMQSALVDHAGALWVGTSEGTLRFRSDGVPPLVRRLSGPSEVSADAEWLLRVEGVERFRRGRAADDFRFRLRIDDGPWSAPSALPPDGISVQPLAVGRHTLSLTLEDQAGDVSTVPAVFHVRAQPVPLQDRRWFQPTLVALALVFALLAATSFRSRRHATRQASALAALVAVREDALAETEIRYRGLYELSRDVVLLADARLVLFGANPAGRKWLEFEPDEVISMPLADLLDDDAAAALRRGIDTLPSEWPCTIRSRSGRALDALLTLSPSGQEGGFQVHLRDVSRQRSLEKDLRRQKHQLELAVVGSGGGEWAATFGADDPQGTPTSVHVSDSVLAHLGYTRAEFEPTAAWWEARVHPDDLGLVKDAASAQMRGEVSGYRHEYRVFHKNGSVRWLRSSGQRVPARGEHAGLLVGIHWDVTEQKRKEERGELLVRELDHRVKNSLATVLAIAQQTYATSTDLDGFHVAFRGRIEALARVHETLARRGWDGALLGEVIARCLEPYRTRLGERVSTDGPDLNLPVSAVPTIAMTLHELSTNAAKYGSLSAAGGQLHVAWTARREGERQTVDLTWVERGGPTVTEPNAAGFGTTLIRKGVEYELGGSVDLAFEPAGLRCSIRWTI